jgi:hypothetical protein
VAAIPERVKIALRLVRDADDFPRRAGNIYTYVGNDPLDHTDPTGMVCNAGQTQCTADNHDASKGSGTVTASPDTDSAARANKGQVVVKSGATEKIGFVEKDGTFRSPSDAKTGGTKEMDTAKAGATKDDAAVIHGHTPQDRGMVDNTEHGKGMGDSQSVSKGLPNYTVTPDSRMGVHEMSGGTLQFRMVEGMMTKDELQGIQQNLNDAQKLMDNASASH